MSTTLNSIVYPLAFLSFTETLCVTFCFIAVMPVVSVSVTYFICRPFATFSFTVTLPPPLPADGVVVEGFPAGVAGAAALGGDVGEGPPGTAAGFWASGVPSEPGRATDGGVAPAAGAAPDGFAGA
jgi:hypothetical protein